MGMIGEFKEALKPEEALSIVKKIMNTNTIKHSKICKDLIKKVAVRRWLRKLCYWCS